MRSKTGCWLLAGLLLLMLLALSGAAWYWFAVRPVARATGPLSTVLVQLATGSGGDEFSLGDQVAVSAQALSPDPIVKSELFVDGQSLGAVTDSPQAAYWTWQALPPGVHTLRAVATDASGNTGQSQTLILNVLAGSGLLQVHAEDGQTLTQVGASFGASPDEMAASNPQLDAAKPLPEGAPVKVPLPSAGGGQAGPQSSGEAGANGPPTVSIVWDFKFTEAADRTYCYESNGGGNWEKMPKDPFTFFQSMNGVYTQLLPLAQKYELQVQCWGWAGQALKYLGDGKTSFDAGNMPPQVSISGSGFQFTGTPDVPVPVVPFASEPNFPPPYSVREPTNEADCTAHSNPLLAPFICKTLLGASLKQYTLVEWEWKPANCWPGYCQGVVQAVDGYRVYEVDAVSKAAKLLKQVDNASQKIVALNLPWGPTPCYGVRAFVNSPAQESPLATYCPGKPPQAKLVTFMPTAWVTTGGEWISSGDCSDFGGADYYLLANKNQGFGNNGEVLVGEYIVDDGGCFKQGDYAGGVKFAPSLPPGGVIQKAVLRYSTVFMDFGSTGWASPKPASCLAGINKSSVDWSSYSTGNHFSASPPLYGTKFGAPVTSVSQWTSQGADVTAAVTSWIAHPENNRGLNLVGANADPPLDDGTGECLSGLGGFQLDVYYFAP